MSDQHTIPIAIIVTGTPLYVPLIVVKPRFEVIVEVFCMSRLMRTARSASPTVRMRAATGSNWNTVAGLCAHVVCASLGISRKICV